ncbi:Regulation of nuclear pre-mRNA domain containing protein 1B [Xenoophorus captivus]|uniref:Regulation of nuclear pre-mRNA domain containing protein 1B n=1 Tax=Xenoophorus captivus TaxID=1517983 RepID=A0ABV0S5S7_9TELE
MSSFSESALEKKLTELSSSQQSVQTLSLWIIHHRKHSGLIVKVWHRELKKAKNNRKLTFLYLANDVIQNSKKKGPEFAKDFESVLVDACSHVASEVDDGCKKQMERLLNIWKERNLYRGDFIQQLKLAIEDSNSPRPSGDAAVRQKIASLPQEVQDVSLLEKITDKEAADKLSKTVDEACLLLAEYNGRLAAELEDRRQLARMLTEYISSQKEALVEREKKLEEYKQKLARVTRVRKELKSHIQSLPDLSLLPNVTGGLAPLPSAGDLFSTD